MAFHAVRFPLDIALTARGGPERLTDVVTLASGAEERNQRWALSRRRFNAGQAVKSLAELAEVVAFFEGRRGRFHSFLFRDPFDHLSCAPGAIPEPEDQEIGTGDGATVQFQLTKTYGGGFDPFIRPVTKPVGGSVRVAVDGHEQTEGLNFTIDSTTGIVSFAVPPEDTAVVTAGYMFDTHVRFDTDRLDLQMNGFDAGSAPDIPLIEVL